MQGRDQRNIDIRRRVDGGIVEARPARTWYVPNQACRFMSVRALRTTCYLCTTTVHKTYSSSGLCRLEWQWRATRTWASVFLR